MNTEKRRATYKKQGGAELTPRQLRRSIKKLRRDIRLSIIAERDARIEAPK